MRLLVEHCREGDDFGFGDDGSEDLGGTLAIESRQLVIKDDEVRLLVKGYRDSSTPFEASPTTSMSSDSHSSRKA